MNTTSEDRLKVNLAAQVGDINRLYSVIQENPHVLEDIDSIPFVDTPLHVAVSAGHLQFATEIMRLKPSFAWKLNPEGFAPIHLALQHNHKRMVLRLVDINKDLVRAKGREGCTPLHFTSEEGQIDLLTEFLWICPDSIKDVTVRNETALHIAARHGQYEALQVLVGWLMRNSQIGAMQLERIILNWKNEEGNTILHISALQNNLQMLQLLVKTKVDLKAKNFEERSALDIAPDEDMRSVLVGAGANLSVSDVATFADILKSKITLMGKIITFLHRITSDITEDQRNAYLIIATLIITTTYQSVLSPPGGVYQANAGDNNANNTTLNSTVILNSTATATQENDAGTSVMSLASFLIISCINVLSFMVSTMTIFILTPTGIVGTILFSPINLLTYSYLYSMSVISPSNDVMPLVSIAMLTLSCFIYMAFLAFDRVYKWGYHGRYRVGRNRW